MNEASRDCTDPLRPVGRAGDLAAELVTYDPALTKLADLVAIADRRSERTRPGLVRTFSSDYHNAAAYDDDATSGDDDWSYTHPCTCPDDNTRVGNCPRHGFYPRNGVQR